MIETPLWSITNSGTLDIHIGSHTFNEVTYIDWTTMSNILFPLFHDILLARDLNAGINIAHSISLPVSTLYSFCNATSSVTNSLVTCLQAIRNVYYREGPEYISPSAGGTISHSRYMPPNKYLPRYLRDIFMIILLRCDGWSPQGILPILGSDIISWSKDIEHLTYNYIWVYPSHHSLMTWPRY